MTDQSVISLLQTVLPGKLLNPGDCYVVSLRPLVPARMSKRVLIVFGDHLEIIDGSEWSKTRLNWTFEGDIGTVNDRPMGPGDRVLLQKWLSIFIDELSKGTATVARGNIECSP